MSRYTEEEDGTWTRCRNHMVCFPLEVWDYRSGATRVISNTDAGTLIKDFDAVSGHLVYSRHKTKDGLVVERKFESVSGSQIEGPELE